MSEKEPRVPLDKLHDEKRKSNKRIPKTKNLKNSQNMAAIGGLGSGVACIPPTTIWC